MGNDSLDILAAVAEVLSGIKVLGMRDEVLADTGGHAQTKVGVDVDLADCALCGKTKLILRNADGILQSAAVGVDDLDILLRDGGRTVQDDREAGKPSGNLFQNVQTKLGICAGFELVCTVACADCDRQGVNAGPLDKFLDLVGICEHSLVSCYTDCILDACQSAELCLYDTAVLMRVLCDLFGLFDILFERVAGIVDHDRREACVNAVLAGCEVCAVIQMHRDRDIRIQLNRCFNEVSQILGFRIFPGACGSLQDNRGLQFSSCLCDRLNDLHIVDIECTDCVTASIRFLKHFGCCH